VEAEEEGALLREEQRQAAAGAVTRRIGMVGAAATGSAGPEARGRRVICCTPLLSITTLSAYYTIMNHLLRCTPEQAPEIQPTNQSDKGIGSTRPRRAEATSTLQLDEPCDEQTSILARILAAEYFRTYQHRTNHTEIVPTRISISSIVSYRARYTQRATLTAPSNLPQLGLQPCCATLDNSYSARMMNPTRIRPQKGRGNR
jgi:hypothetical protein